MIARFDRNKLALQTALEDDVIGLNQQDGAEIGSA